MKIFDLSFILVCYTDVSRSQCCLEGNCFACLFMDKLRLACACSQNQHRNCLRLPFFGHLNVTETNKVSNHLIFIFKEELHAFFISSAILKLVKNQANSKQHSKLELLLFESYSNSLFTLLPKNNRKYPKKIRKRIRVFVFMKLYN